MQCRAERSLDQDTVVRAVSASVLAVLIAVQEFARSPAPLCAGTGDYPKGHAGD